MEAHEILTINAHKAGFFSSCSMRLLEIINFFKKKKIIPYEVNSSLTFGLYNPTPGVDITNIFFKDYHDTDISFNYERDFSSAEIMDKYDQFHDYKSLHFSHITPFVRKFFTPSTIIQNITDTLVTNYNINTDNCIGLYYRGTDKITETKLDSFDSYYLKLQEIVQNNPITQILVQTDEARFIDFLKSKSLQNIIIITENSHSYNNRGIHNEKTPVENYRDMQNLFATFLIIAKCKYIICSSGNCSVWMMYFRGNADGIMQNLNYNWL